MWNCGRLLQITGSSLRGGNKVDGIWDGVPRTICGTLDNTGRFIMFSVNTNVYNKKTKGPTLMEFFTAIGKLNMFTRVWQELEYRIDVCRVTRGAHIEHL